MADFILENKKGGHFSDDGSGTLIRTENARDPLVVTAIDGEIYITEGKVPDADPSVSPILSLGESLAFGGEGQGTPEVIGVRAVAGTVEVRVMSGPFASRGVSAIGGGGVPGPPGPEGPAGPSPGFITESVDYYVHYSGDDVTGDGTIGNPWFSPNKAADQIRGKTVTGPGVLVRIFIEPGPTEDAYNGVIKKLHPWLRRNTGNEVLFGNVSLSLTDTHAINGANVFIGPHDGAGGFLSVDAYGSANGGTFGMTRCSGIYVSGHRSFYGLIDRCENCHLAWMIMGYTYAPSIPRNWPKVWVRDSRGILFTNCWFFGGSEGILADAGSQVSTRYVNSYGNTLGVSAVHGSVIELGSNTKSGYNNPYEILSIAKDGDNMVITLEGTLHRWDQEINQIYVYDAASQNNGFFDVLATPQSLGEDNIIRAYNPTAANEATSPGSVDISNIGPAVHSRYGGTVYVPYYITQWHLRGNPNTLQWPDDLIEEALS